MNKQPEHPITPYLFLSGAILCFASVPIFIKFFTGYVTDPRAVNGVRYGTAALFWLPFVIRNHRNVPPGRNVWIDAIVPSVVNIIGQVVWAICPYYNDASIISFAIRSSFLFATIFGFWLLPGERMLAKIPSFWAGVVLIAGGFTIMYSGGLDAGGTSAIGLGVIITTAVFWGLYAVSVKKYMQGHTARLSFGVICLYTAIGLEIIMFATGDWRQLGEIPHWVFGMLMLSGMIGIATAHVLNYRAIYALGPIVTSGISLVGPFITVLAAYLILGESMTPLQWAGGLTLIAGSLSLVLAQRTKARLARILEEARAAAGM